MMRHEKKQIEILLANLPEKVLNAKKNVLVIFRIGGRQTTGRMTVREVLQGLASERLYRVELQKRVLDDPEIMSHRTVGGERIQAGLRDLMPATAQALYDSERPTEAESRAAWDF